MYRWSLRSFVGIRALAANLRCRGLRSDGTVRIGYVGTLRDFHLHAGRNVRLSHRQVFGVDAIECLLLSVPAKPANAAPHFDLCAGRQAKESSCFGVPQRFEGAPTSGLNVLAPLDARANKNERADVPVSLAELVWTSWFSLLRWLLPARCLSSVPVRGFFLVAEGI